MNPAKKIFTIPAGAPFAKSLAERLLKDTEAQPESLSSYRIFLPTRRACATLKDAFLSLSDAPLLLPRLQPLGDIDEEELSLSLAGIDESAAMEILNLPPAIAPLRRQILLARTIERLPDFTRGFDQALELAIPLARFMDQIYTEGLRLENLATLAPEEFADHWQITIKFLEILSQAWPQILAEEGLIDAADRRNRLRRGRIALQFQRIAGDARRKEIGARNRRCDIDRAQQQSLGAASGSGDGMHIGRRQAVACKMRTRLRTGE